MERKLREQYDFGGYPIIFWFFDKNVPRKSLASKT
jgi:hypothetical protein